MKFRKTLGTRIFVDCVVIGSLAYQCKLAFDSHSEWQIFLMAFLIGSYAALTVAEL